MDRMHRLDILPPAQAELEEIASLHCTLAGPQSARRITDAIYGAMEQLTRFPLSGPSVPDEQMRTAGYRFIVANQYLVFYRFLGGVVVIYHIVHGATNYPKLFHTSFFG